MDLTSSFLVIYTFLLTFCYRVTKDLYNKKERGVGKTAVGWGKGLK